MTRSRFFLPLILALAAIGVLGAASGADRGAARREDRTDASSPWSRATPGIEAGGFEDDRVETEDIVEPDGRISPFLVESTDVRVTVTGPVAHTIVVQQWRNPNRVTVDGLYIFPLPDNAAVTDMRLTIGSRVIEAEMRRREAARAIYERARAEGRVAGLLDQERPNIFAQRVANIVPGMHLEVTLEFDQEVRCDDGACAYILPTVVGPRFVPARQGDPGEILPPVVAPGHGTGQTLTFALDLDAGLPAHDVQSPTHRMRIDTYRGGRASVTLADERARLDRDIEVRWGLGGREPEFGVLAWRGGTAAGRDRFEIGRNPDEARDGASEPGVFALYVQPPIGADEAGLAAPRELVFLLDCSGSMRGEPLAAAKEVVRRALGAARDDDTLQILRFSDQASGLWPEPVPASAANVRRALEFLDTLDGEGGTHMLAGVRAALDRPADQRRLRIVAFLTDGYIGNETEVLGEVRRLLGDARVFAFGIGSSVNRYLLENLASEGRGAAAFLARGEASDDLVRRFVERIATPVFTDIQLSWEGLEVEDLEPGTIPDLFAGQPLVIHGRYRRPGAGAMVLEGRLRGRREILRRAVTLPAFAADGEALGRLWARARVDRLTRETYGRPHPDTVDAVTDLGLRFHLMTPYTSLVAVDSAVSNRGGTSLPVGVPVEMPAGVSHEGIFGVAKSGFAGSAAMPSAPPQVGRRAAPPFTPPPTSIRESVEGATAGGVAAAPPAGGRPAPPVDESGRSHEPKERVRGDGTPVGRGSEAGESHRQGQAFLEIVLVEEDGTRRTIQEDGEAWIDDGTTRRLARTLAADRIARLRAMLAAADVARWSTGEATWARGRSHLVIVLPGGITRSAALPSGDPAVRALADLVRAATS